MSSVRWGIIGCGDVTEVKSGPAFQKVDGSELVAVMRRTASLAEDYARRHGVPRWHDDAEAILQADDIDAVYIATHPNTHKEYTLRAAAAGKAVYVEKPMAMNEEECREMQAACDTAGVPLWVAYYRRALPRFTKIKDLVDGGAIGAVRAVNSYRSQKVSDVVWQNRSGLSTGGFFFDSACHTFDYLDYLFGPITEVEGLATNHSAKRAHEDTVSAVYRFESGVTGSGTWCFDADSAADVTTIFGATGTLSFSMSAPDNIRIARGKAVEELAIGYPAHHHQFLVETIVNEINGKAECPSTGRTAARTAHVMDRILAKVVMA